MLQVSVNSRRGKAKEDEGRKFERGEKKTSVIEIDFFSPLSDQILTAEKDWYLFLF